ncbi:MAG: c-type cytochrome [Dongiaceae bacterium]
MLLADILKRSRRGLCCLLIALAQSAVMTTAVQAADDAGAAQFKKSCGTCHSLDPKSPPRQGPNLHGVVGRPAGAVKGFKYSPAFLKGKSGIVWDAATLDRWIANPQEVIPGVVMMYHQSDAEKRQLVIDYLKAH